MDKEKDKFKLCRGFTLDEQFTATFADARRKGNSLAERLGKVTLYVYNDSLHRWELCYKFLGHMRVVNRYGDMHTIKPDFTGLEPMRKEVAR